MGGKRNEIYGAALVVPFPESKTMSPSQSGAAGFCIPDRQINAAANVVTDNGALASPLLLRYAMRMPEHTRHPESFSVIAGRADVVENAMQKQCVAKFRASLRAQASIRNNIGAHFLGSVFNATKDLPRRITHHRVAAMREAAKPVLVIAKMNRGRLKLPQETQSREQIVGHAFSVVRIVGVASCSRPERGHIHKIPKVKNGLRGVSLAEGEHCLCCSRIGKMTVGAGYSHPPFPLACYCRHEAAAGVKALS